MTNLEALTAITPFTANSNLLSKVLVDLDIVESDLYESKDNIDYASAIVVKKLFQSPDFSEGSLSVKYDKNKMIKYANSIFDRLNKQDEKIIINKINFL